MNLYIEGEIDHYSPMPDNYFSEFSAAVLREYRGRLDLSRQSDTPLAAFPEHLVLPRLKNTWRDSATAVVGAWIGLIYQITSVDRHQPFMNGVDIDNPLGL